MAGKKRKNRGQPARPPVVNPKKGHVEPEPDMTEQRRPDSSSRSAAAQARQDVSPGLGRSYSDVVPSQTLEPAPLDQKRERAESAPAPEPAQRHPKQQAEFQQHAELPQNRSRRPGSSVDSSRSMKEERPVLGRDQHTVTPRDPFGPLTHRRGRTDGSSDQGLEQTPKNKSTRPSLDDTRNRSRRDKRDSERAGGTDVMTENIYVPYHMVGRIIGKGSKTVLELEKITGCDIKLTRASRIDEKGEVALTGSEGARKKAKEHIQNLLYKESITVPAWAFGNILGRGGRTHRKLQNDTGCRIGFPGLDEAKPDVVIDLFGSANALKLATHEICMIVEAERHARRRQEGQSAKEKEQQTHEQEEGLVQEEQSLREEQHVQQIHSLERRLLRAEGELDRAREEHMRHRDDQEEGEQEQQGRDDTVCLASEEPESARPDRGAPEHEYPEHGRHLAIARISRAELLKIKSFAELLKDRPPEQQLRPAREPIPHSAGISQLRDPTEVVAPTIGPF